MNGEQHLRKIQTDPRPTDELIQLMLSYDDKADEYYNALSVLHFRGTREVLNVARELCWSIIPKHRVTGVAILGKLGESARMLREAHERLADDEIHRLMRETYADTIRQLEDVVGDAREFPEEVIPILLQLHAEEVHDDVMESLAHALGHYTQYDHAVIMALVQLAEHEREEIRHATAMSLGGVDDPAAIETIIRLTTDSGDIVRDWATFSLAKLINTDTVEIRNALADRLDDEDDEVYGEAICGLANRGDLLVVDALLSGRALNTADDYRYYALINAGINIGDPRLLPLLLMEKAEWGEDDSSCEYQELLAAIARCLPDPC